MDEKKVTVLNSTVFTLLVAVIVVLFAVVIAFTVQTQQTQSFSQIITVGPVWPTDQWSCTSSADFVVSGTLRGLANAQLQLSIDGYGGQSLYSFIPTIMQSFQLGSPADHTITITRTGTITGWITLQTMSGAKASCTQT